MIRYETNKEIFFLTIFEDKETVYINLRTNTNRRLWLIWSSEWIHDKRSRITFEPTSARGKY